MSDLEELMALGMSWELAQKVMAVSGGSKPTLASIGVPATWRDNPAGANAVFFDSRGGPILQSLDQGADNLNTLIKTAPAAPYFIGAGIALSTKFDTPANSWGGLVFRDTNTGKLIGYGIVADPTGATWVAVWGINFSNASTYGGSSTNSMIIRQATIWVGVADDGTNISYWFSQDGVSFVRVSTTTRAAGYLGANGYNQVGLFISAHGSDASMNCYDWRQYTHAPAAAAHLYTP